MVVVFASINLFHTNLLVRFRSMHLFCKNEKEHVLVCNVNLQYEALLALIPKNTTMDATPDRQLDRVESEGKSLLAVFPGKRIARLDVDRH